MKTTVIDKSNVEKHWEAEVELIDRNEQQQ
jgi:hypothetical protein